MAKGKGGNTVAAVWEIAKPIAEQLGLEIWDIRFVKEGADWFRYPLVIIIRLLYLLYLL